MFPQLGHVPHEEDPAATAAAERSFLDEIEVRVGEPTPAT